MQPALKHSDARLRKRRVRYLELKAVVQAALPSRSSSHHGVQGKPGLHLEADEPTEEERHARRAAKIRCSQKGVWIVTLRHG